MLAELRDGQQTTGGSHAVSPTTGPTSMATVATTSILENLIDDAERRTWFLFEAGRAHRG